MILRIILGLAVLLLAIDNTFAQPDDRDARGLKKKQDSTTAVKGNTYAIIIGLSNYKNVDDLQFADKDATSFENFLLSPAGGSVPKTNIETFLNENAIRTNVGDAISVVARKAKPGDRVYFFFAGHGDMEDLTQIENGLLLLHNSPNGNYFGMNDDVLEILDLKRYLSPLAQRGVEMIFIVDACHSGNLKGGVEGVQQTASALTAAWGKEYKILSCQPNQLSLESAEWGGGRGLFSLQLEEGMKGLADMDNNGVISMFELQSYIQTNVAKYSEGKQIPLVSGDLSKSLVTVNPSVLAALKIEKAKNYPILAKVNTKGNNDKYVDSLDPAGKKIYASFKKNMESKRLIWPKDTNALKDYRAFEKKYAANPLTPIMRRNLAASLNERFDAIVGPLLKDETSYSTKDACYYAAAELDSCMKLLGEQHYMYTNLKARKLFMDAMSITWALTETEYNISLKPDVEEAISLLEQSEKLEPNAAYTLSALGVRYYFIYEYDKAFAKFQKYLALRPNDFYSKYSLGNLYLKINQHDKAQAIFEKMIEQYPEMVLLRSQLFQAYFNGNKLKEALACAKEITDSLDTVTGYFTTGMYYSRTDNMDSAVYYYRLSKALFNGCTTCDNNIGQTYFVNGKIDSASYYFNRVLAVDSTDPFPHFNLATIDAVNGEYRNAIYKFATSIDYSPAFKDAFVTHLELYYNKKYTVTDSSAYLEFKKKSFVFDLQHLGYTSILYCFLRDAELQNDTARIQLVFSRLFNTKDHDVYTWYHHACSKALKQDKKTALESLEKSLKLGFGNYFLLTSDDDLSLLRDSPEFKALLKKYFPDKNK
jgi:tetratricopeptide (TPR) repeat protein